MNWYKQAKPEFDYHYEHDTLWNKLLDVEKKRQNVSFDLENDDSIGDIRKFPLDVKDNLDRKWSVLGQMFSAGGDWENSVVYFRGQFKAERSFKEKFIFIPPKEDGNNNLIKSDKGWAASQDEDWQKTDEPKLWKSFKKYAAELAKKIINNTELSWKTDFLARDLSRLE